MENHLFFDNASTTRCCPEAVELLNRYASEDYGNPSSSHSYGQAAQRAIREARLFFAGAFRVEPEQVIFTGGGTEADNLALQGVALGPRAPKPLRILYSATEHAAVKNSARALSFFGIEAQPIPVDSSGQIQMEEFDRLITPETGLVSIHGVNNITGAILPIEELARFAKKKAPQVVFHSDCIQAFGKIPVPDSSGAVDLISLSGHKIRGPKGVGALIVTNRKILERMRPVNFGGGQEGGLRSGTQNPGLIAAFGAAAKLVLEQSEASHSRAKQLRERLHARLSDAKIPLRWNSPENAVPHIVSLSAPGMASGPLARLLDERHCLVSTGSACSSQKVEPDPVLAAMGLPNEISTSAIRVSFAPWETEPEHVDQLVLALEESLELMSRLMGGRKSR